ncbi:MAG: glyceraldehyde-3-phosphate dehydrogenase [Halioglobus sp.]|nr:glyceraldehyde-3-phosphate dehydrogenase [Halioglobus sp.]
MGFGQIGRQIYDLASRSADVDVVAVADIGKPDILHYLLTSETTDAQRHTLEGNFLVNSRFRARLMQIDRPEEMPWDIFDVDIVIDATGKFRDRQSMEAHLANGAPRVLLRTLPIDHIDRIVVPGINADSVAVEDRMISAGSPTASALCLLLQSVSERFEIECGSMTTVHAYTSDQSLQDYAGSDFRRSRSAAKNIIPNTHEASLWLGHVLPELQDRIMTWALNVPVQEGCLLDVTLVMKDADVSAEDVNEAMRAAAVKREGIVGVVEDPVVSSDVIGNSHSLLFDTKGTIKAGSTTIKLLGWYESLGHAARLLEVARLYSALGLPQEKK